MTGFEVAATLLLAAALSTIAVIDLRSFRIPDWLSLPLVALGLGVAVLRPGGEFADHLIGAAVGYGALAAFGALFFRLRGIDGLGLGDAKLFGAAGAWLGWQGLPGVLLIAALAGLAFALTRGAAARGQPIAFGPWLALGFMVAWVLLLAGIWPRDLTV